MGEDWARGERISLVWTISLSVVAPAIKTTKSVNILLALPLCISTEMIAVCNWLFANYSLVV